MVRTAAVLVSVALHTVAVLAAVGLAEEIRLPIVLESGAPSVGPIRVLVPSKRPLAQRTGAPAEEIHHPRSAGTIGRGLRTNGRPQFSETVLVEARHPSPSPAAAPSPSPALSDGESSRRRPGRADRLPWSALLIVGSGEARAPAPSEFCVPRAPAMPEAAVEQDVSGRVVARYDVLVTGEVGAIEFINRPPEALAGAVRDWLRGCLFEPAMLNGHHVPVRQEQSFLFVLQ